MPTQRQQQQQQQQQRQQQDQFRQKLTNEQKQQICEYHYANPGVKQLDLAKHFQIVFQLPTVIPKSTISDIVRNKQFYRSGVSIEHRSRFPQNPQMEQMLYEWYLTEKDQNDGFVSDVRIVEKAEELGKQMNLNELKFTNGWLYRFKLRHKIAAIKSHVGNQDTANVSGEAVNDRDDDDYFIEQMFDETTDFDSTQIDNDCEDMTNEYFIETSGSVSPSSETATAMSMAGSSSKHQSSSANNEMDSKLAHDTNATTAAMSSTATSGGDGNGGGGGVVATTGNVNMEYDQIKYNFLKLLKQFKIFEFDKFMKWLEKLVYDYQSIGYNVIENLENEFLAFSNNKNLQHKPLTLIDHNQQTPNGNAATPTTNTTSTGYYHRMNGNSSSSNNLLSKNQQSVKIPSSSLSSASSSSNGAASAGSTNSGLNGVKQEAYVDELIANSKLSDLITSTSSRLQQQQAAAAAAAVAVAQHQHQQSLNGSQHTAPLSPPNYFAHASILNTPSGRVFKSKINEQQINALETVFKQKQYLNQFEKEQLSNLLNITALQVKSWFKNRRYRQKKNEIQQQQLSSQQQVHMNTTQNDSTNEDDDLDDEDHSDEEDLGSQQNEYHDDGMDGNGNGSSSVGGLIEGDDVGDETCADVDDDVDHDQENTINSDSNENDMDQDGNMLMHQYNYHQTKQSPKSTHLSPTAHNGGSAASLLQQQQHHHSSSTSLLAAAALAAVTTNVPVLQNGANGGSPLFYHPSAYQLNTIKFSKGLNDELERVFNVQKYISNTQRDCLADKFHVASTQITNWFQNKRRKLKRLERNQSMNRIKSESAQQLAYNAINEQLRSQQHQVAAAAAAVALQQQANGSSQNRVLIKSSPILNRS